MIGGSASVSKQGTMPPNDGRVSGQPVFQSRGLRLVIRDNYFYFSKFDLGLARGVKNCRNQRPYGLHRSLMLIF